LIIDEWLREELKEQACIDILDLIDERHGKASIIFCSQLPVADWHKNIGSPTVADAILDRIVFSSHRIEIKGKSMRQKQSLISL
jgi:DNA replication protein DnaC